MKQLSTTTLTEISNLTVLKPGVLNATLPEKVLQFGTGVLLRGLPDYFIDKANRAGLFNGRVVVVKSTGAGSADEFALQDGLYTVCVRGIEAGNSVTEDIINGSISRVISATSHWHAVLACAANPDLKIIISNTTEVGISRSQDRMNDNPPSSFPGKLLAFLYERYKVFEGSLQHGFVIIPTELIPDNGAELKKIIIELGQQNALDDNFMNWVIAANYFCNSLVDRIVPGKLPKEWEQQVQQHLGYTDQLMIMCEPYKLWAIESVQKEVIDALSFAIADDAVKLVPDLTAYRELKLRLLNGTHSFCCGLAHLSGFRTVAEAMKDAGFLDFVQGLMNQEIVPCLVNSGIDRNTANDFAKKTVDRFSNPYIDHQWLSITVQYTSKMLMRNIPLILKYYQIFGIVPPRMAKGFAAYILFMRPESIDDRYLGNRLGKNYPINDIHAHYFWELYQQGHTNALHAILSNTVLWNDDLSLLPGFEQAVQLEIDLLNSTDQDHAKIYR